MANRQLSLVHQTNKHIIHAKNVYAFWENKL